MEGQAEAYERLWNQPPACFSETDIFEKRICEHSKSCVGETHNSVHQNMAKNFASANSELSQSSSPKANTELNKLEPEKKEESNEPKGQYGYKVNGKKIRLTATSCLIFNDNSLIRKVMVAITFWKYTDFIIFAVIIMNAIILGIPDYTRDWSSSTRNSVCWYLQYVFSIFFLCEAVIKIFAVGLIFGQGTYLRNPWNWLDLGVVVSIVAFWLLKINHNWTIFRIFQLLPALQKQKKFIRLRDLISALTKSLLQIAFILVILFLFVLIFSIIGKSAFAGVPYMHCVAKDVNLDPADMVKIVTCGKLLDCPENWQCMPSDDTFTEDYADFYNMAEAMLAVFRVSTLDNWGKLMRTMEDGYSRWFSVMFHIACVFTCGCFILNLTLPILREHYFVYITKPSIDRLKEAAVDKKLTSTLKLIWNVKISLRPSKFVKRIKSKILTAFNSFIDIIKRKIGLLSLNQVFNGFIIFIILFNDAIQATNHYPGNSLKLLRQIIYYICLIIFILEVLIRTIGEKKFKVYHFVSTIISTLTIIGSIIHTIFVNDASPILCLETLRIFFIVRTNVYIKKISNVFIEFLTSLYAILLIFFIFVYFYAVIGAQLFAGKLRFDSNGKLDLVNGTAARRNYDTLIWSLMSTFQCLVGDDWQVSLYLAAEALGTMSCLYHVSLFIVGRVLMYHIPLAVLLCLFSAEKEEQSITKLTALFKERMAKRSRENLPRIRPLDEFGALKPSEAHSQIKDFGRQPLNEDQLKIKRFSTLNRKVTPINLQQNFDDNNSLKSESASSIPESHIQMFSEEKKTSRVLLSSERNNLEKINESEAEIEQGTCTKIWEYARKSSLFIFHKSWRLRILLLKWVQPYDDDQYYLNENNFEDVQFTNNIKRVNPYVKQDNISEMSVIQSKNLLDKRKRAIILECIMLFFIIFSIIIQILDNPMIDPDSFLKKFCFGAEIFFACLFGLEAFIKIIAMGFIVSSSTKIPAYIRNGWNILDFIVALITLLNVAIRPEVKALRVMKGLRVLRLVLPLLTMTRSEHLKLLITTMISMIPTTLYLSIMTALYVFPVSIITTYAFKGRVYDCSLTNASIENRSQCEEQGGQWKVLGHGFDNIGMSLLSLVQIITIDNWWNVMLHMVDAREPGVSPKQNYNTWWALFIIIYLLIGSMILMNMFTCIFVEFFNKAKLEYCGAANCNLNEQQWINMQRFMLRRSLRKKIPVPADRFRQKCFKLSQGICLQCIDILIAACIIVMYFIKKKNESEVQRIIIDVTLYTCSGIVNIIFLIKFIGYGSFVFQDIWNRIELVVVLIIDIGLALYIINITPVLYSIGNSLQLLTIGRLLIHFKNKKIKTIIDSIVFMLPALFNIAIVISIILLTYSLLGIEGFWNVKLHDTIDDIYNFKSLSNAIVLLFECATGENWNGILTSIAESEVTCNHNIQSFDDFSKNGVQGCGTWWAYPYFFSFVIFVTLAGMKLFPVVVLESYHEAISENYSIITADKFEAFLDKWSNYDPEATGWISIEGLVYLMFSLDPPLGIHDQKVRTSLWDLYINVNRKKKPIIVRNKLIRRLISQIDINEEYLLHKHEPLVIERRKVLLMLKQLRIPVEFGTLRLHFRDVCQRMTIRAISNKNKKEFE